MKTKAVLLFMVVVLVALLVGCSTTDGSPAGEIIDEEHGNGSEEINTGIFGSGTLGALSIGDRVVDPNWNWSFRYGDNFTIDELGDELKPVTWIVVGKNHFEVENNQPHVTLITEELVANYPFDDSQNRGSHLGCGHWGDSGLPDAAHGIRPFLNNTFLEAISSSSAFYKAIVLTTLQNDTRFYADYKWGDNWRPYTTTDRIFILSTSELGEPSRVNDGYALPYFDLSHPEGPEDSDWLKERRITTLLGAYTCYYTRTPETGTISSHLMGVVNKPDEIWRRRAGEMKSNYHPRASTGVRPALNLNADLRVSETPNSQGVYEIMVD